VYAIPLADVVETMRPLPIEPVAAAPGCVLGLAIIRGRPLAVVDVARLVGGGSGRPGRFVTVRAGAREVALAVDEVIGVRTLTADALADLPPLLRDADGAAVDAIGALDAELLFVLGGARLVSEAAIEGAG
jgi:purine-binding chemotaxis protein CheW